MGIEFKGVNKLLKKLENISSIETKKVVEEVANDAINAIYDACPEDEGNSKQCIGVADVRYYPNGTYIDVGFSDEGYPFDKWRGAWFNQWGWNSGGEFHSPNIDWWGKALQDLEPKAIEKLKEKLKAELKAFKE